MHCAWDATQRAVKGVVFPDVKVTEAYSARGQREEAAEAIRMEKNMAKKL